MKNKKCELISFEIGWDREDNKLAYITVRGSSNYEHRILLKPILKINPSECSCEFGSFYYQTKDNIENKKVCRHLQFSIDLLKYLGYCEDWEYECI